MFLAFLETRTKKYLSKKMEFPANLPLMHYATKIHESIEP